MTPSVYRTLSYPQKVIGSVFVLAQDISGINPFANRRLKHVFTVNCYFNRLTNTFKFFHKSSGEHTTGLC